MNQTYDEISQQLLDYYGKVNEYAMSIAEEVITIDLFSGTAGKGLYAPLGLRDELNFIRDEIERWKKYGENL